MNDSCYSWVPLGFANVFICKRSHTHLPCGGGQVVLLGGRLYSNARTHSVAVEDMVEAVKQGLPNALSSGSFSQPTHAGRQVNDSCYSWVPLLCECIPANV